MGIGFAFTAAVQDEAAFIQALERVTNRFDYALTRDGESARVRICHMGDLFLNFETVEKIWRETVISGDCQTNLAGAGFHAAAIDFVDALAEEAALRIEMEDDTDYYRNRDFEELRRRHFYRWLSSVLELCMEERSEGELENFCVCWDVSQYMPANIPDTVVTPFGRFSIEALSRVDGEGLEAFAGAFFLWNERQQDARFYRGSALALLWEECCFMPGSRSGFDRTVNDAILDLLERAAAIDASLPFPKECYLELCALNERTPIDVTPLPDYVSEFPIGYRRDTVTWRVGCLNIPLPGNYLFQYDDAGGNGDSVWFDGLEDNWHTVRVTAFQSPEKEASFHEKSFAGLMPEDFPVGDGWCRAAWAGVIEDEEEQYEDVVAQVICGRQITLITLSYQRQEEREWAFSLLRSMSAHLEDEA